MKLRTIFTVVTATNERSIMKYLKLIILAVIINELLEQIQDSEKYRENFDFENKSSKWLLNALKDEKTYDAIDRAIMTLKYLNQGEL